MDQRLTARFKKGASQAAIAVDPALSNYPRFADLSGYQRLGRFRDVVSIRKYFGGIYAAAEAGFLWYALYIFLQCQNQDRLLSLYAHDYTNSFDDGVLRRLMGVVAGFTFLVAWRRSRMARIAASEWGFANYQYVKRRTKSWFWIFVGSLAVCCIWFPDRDQNDPHRPIAYISFCVLSYLVFGSLYRYVGYRRQVALLMETDRGIGFQQALMQLEDEGAEAPKKLFWQSVLAFLGSLTVIGAPFFSEWQQRQVIEQYTVGRNERPQ